MQKIFIAFLFSSLMLFAQIPPLEKSNFTKLTTHKDLCDFIKEVDEKSNLIKTEVITKSHEAKELFAVYFSKSKFGADDNKIKVLIFAQQHGNEQSGKEGALLLIKELLKTENQYLFDRIDFVLIPQLNPDGSEKNQRRNGNEVDLNRNHLILTEPETIALHKLFDKYLFEVSLDVHEYWPFGEEWKKTGFRRNFDLTIGAVTNINVSEKIKNLSYQKYIPFIFDFISSNGFSIYHYLPGGPIGVDYLRYSTFDINDGRQSFGIQNSFSFIQEGINGENYSTDNIEKRAKSQMFGMLGLLKFSYENKDQIKQAISEERTKLIQNTVEKKVAIQLDHFSEGSLLELPLLSYQSNKDTLITVSDFRSVVKSIYDVERPLGYLIPKDFSNLKIWANAHNLIYEDAATKQFSKIEQYYIDSVGQIDFERDTIINPIVSAKTLSEKIDLSKFFFIPINQLKNNLIVISLEPKSILGLVTYKEFSNLIQEKNLFPILRVIK